MKILLVILHAETARGGAERYTHDLAASLLQLGHEVTTAAATFDPTWPGEKITLPTPGLTRAARYKSFLNNAETLTKSQAQAGHKVHAMLPLRHTHLYHPHAGIAALRKRSAPTDLLNRRRRLMATTEFNLLTSPNPPLTIALSNYTLGQLRSVYPNAPAKVILNGVDTRRYDPTLFAGDRTATRAGWGLAPTDIVLLCVAQDFVRKGVPIAIEALSQLPADFKLVVVGRDKPVPMQRLAESFGVQNRCKILGATADPRATYAASDLFVLPTHHDPCPLVTLEALAMGVPVISTIFNGSTEYMTNGLQGQILPRVDASLFATTIYEYADPSKRQAAGTAALALRPRLDVESHVAALVELYKGI